MDAKLDLHFSETFPNFEQQELYEAAPDKSIKRGTI